ncbi:GTPase family protein [Salisaeta longa]|uniref:GTPase family protein n=1 Tax=Salisaeta longa TaxID=503170 RepID=UPI001469B157|nr:GTPase domain-containing protein [Salisaeta longa]
MRKSINDVIGDLFNLASVKDVFELGEAILEHLNERLDTEQVEHDSDTVAKTLHRIQSGRPPRVALAGMTSAGKTSLINSLFGDPVALAKRTPDTTSAVLRVTFSSGLIVYDTPGVGGDEEYENVTRQFLGIPQDPDLDAVESVPFQSSPEAAVRHLTPHQIEQEAPVDAVLFVIDASRTMTRPDRALLRNILLELREQYGDHVIVAATHIDVLNRLSADERDKMLQYVSNVSDGDAVPVSVGDDGTGEGLDDLVLRLSRSMPSDVRLSKLQESLVEERKLERLSFVVTEASSLLAAIMLLDGGSDEEIQILTLTLYALVSQHYAVDESTWLRCNGDAEKLSEHVRSKGVSEQNKPRKPRGFWENVRAAFFGEEFYTTVRVNKPVGVDGLLVLLPSYYHFLYTQSSPATSRLGEPEIEQAINERSSKMQKLVAKRLTSKLSSELTQLMADLYKISEYDTNHPI